MYFETIDDKGQRIKETKLGSAQLIHKITDVIYVILTCAHNFLNY